MIRNVKIETRNNGKQWFVDVSGDVPVRFEETGATEAEALVYAGFKLGKQMAEEAQQMACIKSQEALAKLTHAGDVSRKSEPHVVSEPDNEPWCNVCCRPISRCLGRINSK